VTPPFRPSHTMSLFFKVGWFVSYGWHVGKLIKYYVQSPYQSGEPLRDTYSTELIMWNLLKVLRGSLWVLERCMKVFKVILCYNLIQKCRILFHPIFCPFVNCNLLIEMYICVNKSLEIKHADRKWGQIQYISQVC
jgi:hypothetical protein